jgi:uncharacterized protein YijF (DUF1287 family)
MTNAEVGEIVSLTEFDSEPAMLVLAVEEDLTVALLADLTHETIQRLKATIGDRADRQEIATTVANDEEIMTLTVPPSDVSHRNEPGVRGCTPPQDDAK